MARRTCSGPDSSSASALPLPSSPRITPPPTPPLAAACILYACAAQPGDVIQCRECGYRILYKKRTSKIVQYEAR